MSIKPADCEPVSGDIGSGGPPSAQHSFPLPHARGECSVSGFRQNWIEQLFKAYGLPHGPRLKLGLSEHCFVFLRFAFFKVLPGDYEILATHPTWALKEVTFDPCLFGTKCGHRFRT